jgi:O104-antigen biosynthesis beta-1,3-galactosyltransferase
MKRTTADTPAPPVGLSCLLSVYAKDDPTHFEQSLKSILSQTRPPDQLVIVEDGPIPDPLRNVINSYEDQIQPVRVSLRNNVGRGLALAHAFDTCNFDLVAMMDADDIARPTRFELQERYMRAHPEVVLLGASIEEFKDQPGDLGRLRRTPETDIAIRQRARRRNPFNQMTVVFRKRAVQAAGGYRHSPGFEDYDLWLRILQLPGQVFNMNEVLVDARIGNGMLRRRRGWPYVKAETKFLNSCWRQGLISTTDMLFTIIARVPIRLVPARVLEVLYTLLLRERRK